MKIDKRTLDMIASLPDDQLWSMIKLVSGNIGAGVESKKPSPEEIKNIRLAIASISDNDIERASEIFKLYKRGTK